MALNTVGTIEATKAYLTQELMEIFGFQQERTLLEWLTEMGVRWAVGPRGRKIVSGRLIIMGIERTSLCLNDGDEEESSSR